MLKNVSFGQGLPSKPLLKNKKPLQQRGVKFSISTNLTHKIIKVT